MATSKNGKSQEDVVDEQNAAAPARNPLWQSGNVSTNDPGPDIDQVSTAFVEARAAALANAAEAIKNGEKNPEGVVLPNPTDTPEDNDAARENVVAAAESAQAELKDKVESQGATLASNEGQELDSVENDTDKADDAKQASGDHK